MNQLTVNQLTVLLWKNFTLKKRQIISTSAELLAALLFVIMLLIFRALTDMNIAGPYHFTPQPIAIMPSFIKDAQEWELIYIPSEIDVVREIIEDVKRNLNTTIKVRGFPSEAEFEEYILFDNMSQKVLAAIVFDCGFKNKSDPLPLQVKYHLRFVGAQRTIWWPDKIGWKTKLLFPNHPSIRPRNPNYLDGGSPGYIKEGFLAVQHALDRSIMLYHESSAGKKLFDEIDTVIQRFPYPSHPQDKLLWISSPFIPLMFILMFSSIVLSIMRSIVFEKEKRLKEYQLIMGLRNWIIWIGYFFTFFPLYVIVILLICILLFVQIVEEPVLRYSDCSFIFVFLTCYAIASICFAFMVSTFFSKTRLAASAGNLLFFASFFPYNFISEYYGMLNLTTKITACLSANVALALGINILIKLEIQEIGVKWHNLWTPANLEDNLNFGYMLGMLLFDAFLYSLVTWYVEAVFPGQCGVPQPWYFFLMRSYWFGKPKIRKTTEEAKCTPIIHNCYEAEPPNLEAGIHIMHLHKEFRNKPAVNNLSLNIYEGQVTVLLGHNGAGKTTTLSVLTGRFAATRGEAYINGYNISDNMIEVRKDLGFCPQHDLLFDDLTLSEHLFFYCMIKGIPQNINCEEIDRMLSAFNLQENYHTLSGSVSGGVRRKLSIVLALMAGSKVVILDEPSSGMDPVSRRATWDILQHYKHNRTILLTTHYMDEADVLGDRVAIMVRGTLHCCGSSVFLKQIYGAGYHIVMEKEQYCDVDNIIAMIQQHVPGAVLENNIENELSFILPKKYVSRFETLFTELEMRQKALGIASFGASITTMEEVFVKVNKLATPQKSIQTIQPYYLAYRKMRQDEQHNVNMPINYSKPNFPYLSEIATVKFNTGVPLYRQQFYSLFIKRALFISRNWKFMLLQIIVVMVVTTYLLLALHLDNNDIPERELNLSHYGRTIVPYSTSGNSDLALKLTKNLNIFLKSKNQNGRKIRGDMNDYILKNKDCHTFCLVALSIKVERNKTVLTIFFNNEAYHSPAISLSILDNILFMTLSGPDASITVFNKPQPLPHYGSNIVPVNGLQIVQCLAFGISVVVGSFSIQTVTERISQAKHIQFLTGVCVHTYWLSALLCDLIFFFFACCVLLGIFKFCQLEAFVVHYNFLDTILIFMLYGWCVVPLTYIGSFLFNSSTAAYIKITLFNYFSTMFSIIIYTIIQFYGNDFPNFVHILTRAILMALPSYNLAMSISKYFDDYEVKRLCAREFKSIYVDCSDPYTQNNVYGFGEHGIGKFLITLATMGLVFLLLLLSLESVSCSLKSFVFRNVIFYFYNKLRKGRNATPSNQRTKEDEDEDIKREKGKVFTLLLRLQNTPLLLNEVTKIYFKCPVVKAVKNISLVVKKSECFGLLGLNGAGKTTTFKMLTAEETITSGIAFIDGNSVTRTPRKIRSRIGYCPQTESVLNHMTGRESLVMYARLWGVLEQDINEYVEAFLHSVHLEPIADQFIHTYSAGSKRRLSTAIALMGKSSVVFLDEPSIGMDPVAQHLLWETITWICKTGKAIIITSHRMEECEALCTRLAIMVKGRFTCLGTPQHVRKRFGHVYTLTVRINIAKDEDKVEEFKNFIKVTFPGNIKFQEFHGTIGYYIPSKEIYWGKVFAILEEAKVLFKLEDYSVKRVTLEQIFLTFANTDKMRTYQEIKLQ
ncbi:ATP-binding cassette sub-family A member 3-like isoform X1 [Mus caroli]|uniref:ATP-binding cassette sub-family A member 3-like isoform X1 n=3 Tax=Mus caroli TaxID=10089 RepID=A0A6P7R6G3_MUSCR|nr:ATP-binding cassette sub-family A member 3-like isoform X1 [Mus caroli]